MIGRTTVVAFFLLALFTGGVLFKALYPSKQIKIEETLTETLISDDQEEKYPSNQVRKEVSKDLWINDKEGHRLHHHIESPESLLTAISHGSRMELIEQMKEMKCFFQEKLEEGENSPFQYIRYFESDEGIYHYTGHSFDAPAVFLALYHLPGKELPTSFTSEEAYLKGIAETVSLSFPSGTPTFHAEKFKAEVSPQKKAP